MVHNSLNWERELARSAHLPRGFSWLCTETVIRKESRTKMPRAPRILAPGAIYHLMAHANEDRQSIFMDDTDRAAFLSLFGEIVTKREWTHLSHCLMTTHFHLVARTYRPNLSEGMRDLLALYARQFNRRHKRAGHLFRDRYLSVLVEDDRQLITVLRYVAWNPVDAGIVTSANEWPWSSYAETMGGPSQTPSLDVDAVLTLLHRNQIRARELLREAVGSEMPGNHVGPSPANGAGAPSLRTLAQVLPPNAAIVAADQRGFPRADIAAALGLSLATISRRLSLVAKALQPDPHSQAAVHKKAEIDSGTDGGVWSR